MSANLIKKDYYNKYDFVFKRANGRNIYDDSDIGINQIGYGASSLLIVEREVRQYDRLNATGERLLLRFINPDMENMEGWLTRCISELLSTIERDMEIHPADRVGIN